MTSPLLTRQNAFAYRILEVADRPGETVEVFIGKPEIYRDNEEEWICRYRIVGAGKDMQFGIIGIDGVQALQHAFVVIDSAIIGADMKLTWLGQSDLGFVVKPNMPHNSINQ